MRLFMNCTRQPINKWRIWAGIAGHGGAEYETSHQWNSEWWRMYATLGDRTKERSVAHDRLYLKRRGKWTEMWRRIKGKSAMAAVKKYTTNRV
jgi:transposase-like protein